MLFYGGIALIVAGIIFLVAADKVIKDPTKAANAKKQAPIYIGVGVLFVVGAVILGGMLA